MVVQRVGIEVQGYRGRMSLWNGNWCSRHGGRVRNGSRIEVFLDLIPLLFMASLRLELRA